MALNEHEEGFLRRFIRDHMPLAPPPPVQPQPKRDESIEPIIEAGLKQGKLVTQNMDEDYSVISILQNAGVLRERPGKIRGTKEWEHLAEFYARTQLGRAQIIEWRRDLEKIKAFVAQVEANDLAEGIKPPPIVFEEVAPRVKQQRFLMVG